ncbi:bifunctional riboflavin kinase/FMN phosphatase [Lolium perenne]|uniref:bifunctional riboflavin kinase/FMN phosphatase n=1 Tax=Lolium perenne TaxID=4522 RepID=UPI0021F5988E|nr:bifunctional riboflavin kinase/FMN phosphatase-like [Lolium perenne]
MEESRSTRQFSHVILGLDGTLLNTDYVVQQVLKSFLVKEGKTWDSKKAQCLLRKGPYEAAVAVLEEYELPYSAEEFLNMITPMFNEKWGNIKALAGANRLVQHLRSKGVSVALASNSPRENIRAKIGCHPGWEESFVAIVGGDEVTRGKPAPDIFVEAAKRMNSDPSNCIVIEDSLQGVLAGKAADMHVIAVPSIPKSTAEFGAADEVINSLLDLRLEKWGLTPFVDWIEDTLPIEPWFISGPVIKGYGRGSRVLGIPTANLPADKFSDILSEHTSGVYFGWAGLRKRAIYKMVMSIGWNPYFHNSEKTIEPWILHDFSEDFYGEELSLAIIGYIRPEANFSSVESLIERIREDGRIAEKALDLPIYACYKDSPYLRRDQND